MTKPRKKVLLLHGSRQTGQLLLGRMNKLRKQLEKEGLELVAPDAPFVHPDDAKMRHWWNLKKQDNICEGLDTETMELLQSIWESAAETDDGQFVGIMGFSQGARLIHLLLLCHELDPKRFFPGVRFGILVAGYDAPFPPNLKRILPFGNAVINETRITVPSLHVIGVADKLISPEQSRAVLQYYREPTQHEHEGGHHVPMRAASVRSYMNFIKGAMSSEEDFIVSSTTSQTLNTSPAPMVPDDETLEMQKDEVEALQAIFPDEIILLSKSPSEGCYEHPIRYRIELPEPDDGEGWWPPKPIALEFEYPHNYPQETMPRISLKHNNNVMEFTSAQAEACLDTMRAACQAEEGMPCVMSCVYAARSFFESGAMADETTTRMENATDAESLDTNQEMTCDSVAGNLPQACSEDRIQNCIKEGLDIAETVLRKASVDTNNSVGKKGGSYRFTIGLVGKPSAGKSTFFNVATAFARQRGDEESTLGGATMAPHPFTTIDPNVGYCLAPAPPGSCPEDGYQGKPEIGSTHGRDSEGRRLLPVLLKDVAGLVPGAYQGRGRGNKFLNDLTDADILIHVLDASGIADESGNVMGTEQDGQPCIGASHPLNDLEWIRKELIEWVYTNLMVKWDTIRRKGRSKLSGMFSGYGQTQGVTSSVLIEIEKFAQVTFQKDKFLDDLVSWDAGDVHRLVSAFLGVRFPMVLALNKMDLKSSAKHIKDIQAALPLHGAHHGVPLSASHEMQFMRHNITKTLKFAEELSNGEVPTEPPRGVWQCLQTALFLGNPVLVFPVSDFTTFAPLPGLTKRAALDPSLPSLGMIACLDAAGGSRPSHWDPTQRIYTSNVKDPPVLRDVLLMKPGSTVEDVFVTLKNLGAFAGEFVRAEGTADIHKPPKPVPKLQTVSRDIRILKIMTNKRSAWQKS